MNKKIILIRHAEKMTDAGWDPPLNKAGEKRALKLTHLFGGAKMDVIYASPALRARQTAQPLAHLKGLEVEIYDPHRPETLLYNIFERSEVENVLIVGHQDTIPYLANIIIDKFQWASFEDNEYDRLIEITINGEEERTWKESRFNP